MIIEIKESKLSDGSLVYAVVLSSYGDTIELSVKDETTALLLEKHLKEVTLELPRSDKDENQIKTLVHGQRIRITNSTWIHKITICTLKGFCKENNLNYDYTMRNVIENNHQEMFTCLPDVSLSADYPGKQEEMEQEKRNHAASLLIEDGDTVMCEGQKWIASYVKNPLRCSVPVQFKKILVGGF